VFVYLNGETESSLLTWELAADGAPRVEPQRVPASQQAEWNLPAAGDVWEIRLPVPGWVSILHRISGATLFFPFAAWVLYLLDTSLRSEQGFDYVRNQYLALPLVKLGILAFIWAYCHHFCAGIRYLFIDLDVGVDLRAARVTSWIVLAVSLLLTAYLGMKFL
jgi:succinate dehydrogenase / fumarate reductase, cytochrome b subunit